MCISGRQCTMRSTPSTMRQQNAISRGQRPSKNLPYVILAGLFVVLTQVGAKEAGDDRPYSQVDRSRGLRTLSEYLFLRERDVGSELRTSRHRALPAHYPTSSHSPVSSSSPTAPSTFRPSTAPPPSPSSSSSSKGAPHTEAPTTFVAPISSGKGMSMGGKGMMMGEGKGGGKGGMIMSTKTKAPVPPKISKTPVAIKTKAPIPFMTKPPAPPVSSKGKKSKSKGSKKSKGKGKESKSKKKDPKKKDPKKMTPKSSSKSHSKSKLSKPPSSPHAPTTTSPSISEPPAPPSTVMPSFAPAPGGSTSVTLTLYQIGYVVSLTTIPSITEVDGVVNVTQQFLSSLFQALYPTMAGFETVKVSDKLQLNAPYEIVYNSTIEFQAGSTVPSVEDLDSQLQIAFTGDTKTEYLSLLAGLGPDNVFSQTTDVVFTFYETNSDAESRQSNPTATELSPTVLAAIGAGTLAVVITTAALVHYVRHRGEIHGGESKSSPPGDRHTGDTTAADDSLDVSTDGETLSYMSPRSSAIENSNDDHTDPIRNPRANRISRQTIDSVESSSSDHDGTTAVMLNRLEMTLSYEGDDEVWANAAATLHHIGNATEEGNDHNQGRRSESEAEQSHRYHDIHLPMSSLY